MESALKQMIFDERQYVTYRTVCSKFEKDCKSSSAAQTILKDFWSKNRKDTEATFVVTGTKGTGVVVILVRQDKIDEARSKFDDVQSECIYSLRATNNIETKENDDFTRSTRVWQGDWELRKKILRGDATAEKMFLSDAYSSIKSPSSISLNKSARVSTPIVSSSAKTSKKSKIQTTTTTKTTATDVTSVPKKTGAKATSSNQTRVLAHKDMRKKSGFSSFFKKSSKSSSSSSFSKNKKKKSGKQTMGSWLTSKPSETKTGTAVETVVDEDVEIDSEEDEHAEKKSFGKRRLRRPGKKSVKKKKVRVDSEEEEEEEEDGEMEIHQLRLAQEDAEIGDGLDMRTEADIERELRAKKAAREKEEREAAAAIEKQKREMRRQKKKLVKKSYRDEDGFLVQEEVWVDIPAEESEEQEKNSAEARAESSPQSEKKRAALSQSDERDSPAKKKAAKKKKKSGKQKTNMFSFFKKK